MNQETANAAFVLLAAALVRYGLARTPGAEPDPTVEADEFMWMGCPKDGVHQFKHGVSRNYVFVRGLAGPRGFSGQFLVPTRDQPFMKGEFPAEVM